MQTTAIIPEHLPKAQAVRNSKKYKTKAQKKSSRNYLILMALLILCFLLLFLGLPFWAVLIFGLGMSFILFLLYLLRGIQIVLDLNQKDLEEAIQQDLFL